MKATESSSRSLNEPAVLGTKGGLVSLASGRDRAVASVPRNSEDRKHKPLASRGFSRQLRSFWEVTALSLGLKTLHWFKNKNECPVALAMLCYAKSLQSCPTLCDPTDGSPPGSIVPGILQARILEWVAISFSSA